MIGGGARSWAPTNLTWMADRKEGKSQKMILETFYQTVASLTLIPTMLLVLVI